MKNKINTTPNMFGLDNHRHLFFGDIEIGHVLDDKEWYYVYILQKRFKWNKIYRNQLQQMIVNEYRSTVKELAESLEENLIWTSKESTKLKHVVRDGWVTLE